MLPDDIRMSCQSSDLIIQLTMNYLVYISDMSNNICNDEGKKTITPSHVAKALKVKFKYEMTHFKQELKMDKYLKQILELGLEDGDEFNLSDKQTKEIISQKLVSQGGRNKKDKNKKKDNTNGMT